MLRTRPDFPPEAAPAASALNAWASLWPRVHGDGSCAAGAADGGAAACPTLPANISSGGRCAAFDALNLTLAGPRAARGANSSAPPRYVVVERRGGLGNQLFQAAHGVVEALASGRTPLLGPQTLNPHATEAYERTIFRRLCVVPDAGVVEDGVVEQDWGRLWSYSQLQLPDALRAVRLVGHWTN